MEQKVLEKFQSLLDEAKDWWNISGAEERNLFNTEIRFYLRVLNECGSKQYTVKNWKVQEV